MKNKLISFIVCILSFSSVLLADDARNTYISKGAPTFVAPAGSVCKDSSSAATYINISGTNTWTKVVWAAGNLASVYVTGTLASGSATLTSPYLTGSSAAVATVSSRVNPGFLSVTCTTGSATVISTSGSDTSVFKLLIQ